MAQYSRTHNNTRLKMPQIKDWPNHPKFSATGHHHSRCRRVRITISRTTPTNQNRLSQVPGTTTPEVPKPVRRMRRLGEMRQLRRSHDSPCQSVSPATVPQVRRTWTSFYGMSPHRMGHSISRHPDVRLSTTFRTNERRIHCSTQMGLPGSQSQDTQPPLPDTCPHHGRILSRPTEVISHLVRWYSTSTGHHHHRHSSTRTFEGDPYQHPLSWITNFGRPTNHHTCRRM